jgi:photosynthetic reaction center cytochrome c subunit
MRRVASLWKGWALAALALPFAAACGELPPMQSQQTGHRGTGMAQIRSPELLAYLETENAKYEEAGLAIPDPPSAEDVAASPRATVAYENVQVLGDLSQIEFDRTMAAITAWVSPEEGCNYCHNPANMASDEVYTKVVARRMLQMTQTINSGWKTHVADTGVTCWTCHRGQPVPVNYWTNLPPQNLQGNFMGNRNGQNNPVAASGYTTLNTDPFSAYLSGAEPIRVQGTQSMRPAEPGVSIQATEKSYGLMVHMSQSLGVNCAFCHNTANFQSWDYSNPARVTAWHGIRMARAINNEYMDPLASVFPANRLGPLGDVFKVNCTTCHQGVNKPMGGVSMIAGFPELARPYTPVPATPSADQGASLAPASPAAAAAATPPAVGSTAATPTAATPQ